MGPTPDQIQLIKDYEPALFFVGTLGSPGAERFFPSDAKRYLEKAALYRINAKDVLKAQWGGPVLGAGNISALAGEDGTFLGDPDTSSPPKYQYLETDPDKELFFDVAGWRPENRFADLDHMAALYAADLKDSQYRYHAEFFDVNRLHQLFDNPADVGFNALFDPRPGKPPVLTDPALICYYLFYPGHEESLGGCTDFNGNTLESARDFGSFAGEWSCIALLLDRSSSAQPYAPKWVGLSNRNTGEIDFGMGEVRSTMRILPWSAVEVYEITHPRLNVAKGSHALYVNGEPLPSISFTDPAAANCGAAAPIVAPGDRQDTTLWTEGLVGKCLAGLALGGPFGAAAGLIWGLAETPAVIYSFAGPVGPAPDTVSNSGFVIYPKGKPPPGVTPGDPNRSAEWKSDPLDIGNRHYDFTVDRATQPLWGADPEGHGYTGRWGPRVEQDPRFRRSGMKFPKFWELFFSSLVRADPPSRTIVLTTDSGSTWEVPADWNNADNSIACIGGGGGGETGTINGGGGGAGGGYSSISNVALTVGATVTLQVGTGGAAGAAGGDSWFNGANLAASSVGAKGGGGGAGAIGGSGTTTDAVGTVKNPGGNGGGGASTFGGGGGGGAAGAAGVGAAGGEASGVGRGGGGGGGGNGGRAGQAGQINVGGNGGNNSAGAGGGTGATDGSVVPGAASVVATAGTNGGGGGAGGNSSSAIYISGKDGGAGTEFDASHGSGGGGGGGGPNGAPGGSANGGNGALYGGGGAGGGAASGGTGAAGGNGADGIIVIRYTP